MSTIRTARRALAATSPWLEDRPKREELRAQKREAILHAAALCFADRGVGETTMDDVAGLLGVTKPTIYRHFRDKVALYRACEERALRTFVLLLAEARQQPDIVAALRHYFGRSLHLMVEDPFGRLLAPAGQPDLYSSPSRGSRGMREQNEAGIRELLEEGVRRGELNASLDPKLVALSLFATFNFVARWYDPRKAYTLDDIRDRYFAMFLDGLVAR